MIEMEQIKVRARITKQGDSELPRGTVVELDYFAETVEMVLRNGGEMPVAVPVFK